MAVDNIKPITLTFKAAEDLNAHEGIAVTIADNKVANNGQEANGILDSKPKNGEHGTIVIFGIVKAKAGGAITVNNTITVATSGYVTVTASGDYIIGHALETITSGSFGKVFVLPSRHYQISSLDG